MARPREFDPEVALDKAMHQFWSKGYYDTSIRDLVSRTGVNYYGLYEVFNSKHGLFLAALERYRQTVTTRILDVLNQPGPAKPAIEAALNQVLASMHTEDGHVGCLMCNTAIELAPHDSEANNRVSSHRELLQSAFRARLTNDRTSANSRSDAELGALSEFLATAVYTIGLLVRAGHDDAFVRRHIGNVLTVLE